MCLKHVYCRTKPISIPHTFKNMQTAATTLHLLRKARRGRYMKSWDHVLGDQTCKLGAELAENRELGKSRQRSAFLRRVILFVTEL